MFPSLPEEDRVAHKDISPDQLATKTFVITLLSAVVYFGTVLTFVINGRPDDARDQVSVDAPYPEEVPRQD
ncbi:MAG: hypothetical protein MJD61_13360 [Proteobacteria bacterium]|nr:hypothetical protein [Pseudomonadota bacterium]